jgi:hypothetical protein
MATIDTSIYGQMLRPVKSIADYDAEYEQAQANKLQRLIQGQNMSMNKMKMDEAQRGVEEENRLRSLLQGLGNAPMPQVTNALRGAGFYKQAMDFEDKARAQEKDSAEIANKDALTDKTKAETIAKTWDIYRIGANQVQSPEGALSYINGLYAHPVLGPIAKSFQPIEQAIAQLPKDPESMLKWKAGHLNLSGEQLLTALKPKLENTGGALQGFDPLTAKPIAGTGAPITESANNRENRLRQEAQAAATLAEQKRNNDMANARARETLVADAGGPTQAALTKKFGKAEPGRRWREDGSLEPIPGGSADLKAGAEGERRAKTQAMLGEQAKSVLGEIADAKKLTGWSTAGAAGLLSKVPMTDARKLAGHVDTIKANLGFDRLQQMRDMSPTGGALGQVAVQEINYLQSTVAKLDQLQDPRDVIKALDKIEEHYKKWANTLGVKPEGDWGAPADKPKDEWKVVR